MTLNSVSIVIIDDDSLIRNALKILTWGHLKNDLLDLKVYSSDDGVDGLGLIYVTNPDIIVVDSTLPKYSGREITEYLISNEKFLNKQVIILNDGSGVIDNLPNNYKVINKKGEKFLKEFTSHIELLVNKILIAYGISKTTTKTQILQSLIGGLVKYANWADITMFKISESNFLVKIPLYIYWVLLQFFSSILYSLVLLLTPQIIDANIKQSRTDLQSFRVRAYPTLVAFFVALIFLVLQFALFIVGGIVIFNSVRIESIFAANENKVSVDFGAALFDTNSIELSTGSIKLKQLTRVEKSTESEEQQVVSFPLENPVEPAQSERVVTYYSQENTSVIFNYRIPFEKLIALYEESSINQNPEESIPDINIESGKRKALTNEELKNRFLPLNTITYQLSPDNENWYYFGSEIKWEKTVNLAQSSNTIQEVNQFLKEYKQEVGGSNLYLKAYLLSDGSTPIELKSIVVERELDSISSVNEISYVEETKPIEDVSEFNAEEVKVNAPNIQINQPTLFSVSYLNGNKIVYGKVLGMEIDDSELINFKVRVYNTVNSDITKSSDAKGDLVGETFLVKNLKGDLTFTLKAIGSENGFVTAELIYTNADGVEIVSNLSKPLGN